jgi:UDP-glucuronate 4-epimerase
LADMTPRTILVTGCAGFIGMHLTRGLLAAGFRVIGLDNLNDYYDVQLKQDRLVQLGIEMNPFVEGQISWAESSRQFGFVLGDVRSVELLQTIMAEHSVAIIFHLAAQVGVRNSMDHPLQYVNINVSGTTALMEACRHVQVEHVYIASSSSVYGDIRETPFHEQMKCDTPKSVYAASKSSAELIVQSYSKLFGIDATALRFFTVYGPWDRPDMALHRFVKRILEDESIDVFNDGNMERDFTYVEDLVTALKKVMVRDLGVRPHGFRVLNIGSGRPIPLGSFIDRIEKAVGKTAERRLLPMQPGDLESTYADTSKIESVIGQMPYTELSKGIETAIAWHLKYYHGEENPSPLKHSD